MSELDDPWRAHAEQAPDYPLRGWQVIEPDGSLGWTGPDWRGWTEEFTPQERWTVYFHRAKAATWELYRRHGWEALTLGPLPGPGVTVSGCEQTEMLAARLSRGDPAAVDGAIAGICAALEEIASARQARTLLPAQPVDGPEISGGLAFPRDGRGDG